MPRNYKKEAIWEKANFDQIKFRVRKEVGAKFKAHLAANGMTAMQWFNHAISLDLVPEKPNTKDLIPINKKKRTPSPSAETVQEWVRLRDAGMSYDRIAATTNGYDRTTVRKRIKAAMVNTVDILDEE